MNTCKNCGNKFEGNYCSNCGQAANTHAINAHFVWHDIQHGLFHIHGGFFYTAIKLFIKPGYSIREYVRGARVRHFGPISMLILVGTLYGFLYHILHINVMKYAPHGIMDFDKLNEWVATHYSFITLFTIPFYSLFSFLIFKKQSYNFFEHIVLNCYLGAQRLSLHILALPLLYFAHNQGDINFVSGVLAVLDILLLFRGYVQFFNGMSKTKAFFYTAASYILATLTITILVSIFLAVMIT